MYVTLKSFHSLIWEETEGPSLVSLVLLLFFTFLGLLSWGPLQSFLLSYLCANVLESCRVPSEMG